MKRRNNSKPLGLHCGTLWPTFNVFCKAKWESNAFINPCTWLLVVWDFWRLFSKVSQCFNVKFTKLGMSRDWTMWLSEEQQLQFPNCCSLEECCDKKKTLVNGAKYRWEHPVWLTYSGQYSTQMMLKFMSNNTWCC